MFDTHCHVQFSRFKKNYEEVISRAKEAGVEFIVMPGTDIPTSQRALEIAQKYDGLYVAVGIHPHHAFEFKNQTQKEQIKEESSKKELLKTDVVKHTVEQDILTIEKLLKEPKVVSIGEVGMDRHEYLQTKYEDYTVDHEFLTIQKQLLASQIDLAVRQSKSLILHNREAKQDLLPIVAEHWNSKLEGRAVFHCCEPDMELLDFAKKHKMFIGVDGDITYYPEKQEFVKHIPHEMIVLETDSPFLLPEPLRTQKKFPNEPANIPFIAEYIAGIIGMNPDDFKKMTTENAKHLFNI